MKINNSNTINAFEAKTHFSNLLQRVSNGEKITIFKHNSPIALLIPVSIKSKLDLKEVIDGMESLRKGKKLNSSTINEFKNEGRR